MKNKIVGWIVVLVLVAMALVSVPTCTVLVVGPTTAASTQYGV